MNVTQQGLATRLAVLLLAFLVVGVAWGDDEAPSTETPAAPKVSVPKTATKVKVDPTDPTSTQPRQKVSPPILPRDTLPQPDPRRLPYPAVDENAQQPLPTRHNNYYLLGGRRVIFDQAGVRRFNNNRNLLIRQRSFRTRR